MRCQSISAAWMAATIDEPLRHRSLTRGSSVSPTNGTDSTADLSGSSSRISGANSRFYAHRSLGSVARRPRRNTTPMRAHLLAVMVQQLAKDPDRDVLDLVCDLPGQAAQPAPLIIDRASAPPEPTRSSRLKEFPQPPPSPPVESMTQCVGDIDVDIGLLLTDSVSAISLPPSST
ncbi:hypothetical protein IWW57_002375 [Coemansia sp. S610]|nr:hypothetical protein IWW57_002375 [Coemansia sp. S610]